MRIRVQQEQKFLVTTERALWRYDNAFIFTNQSEVDFGITLVQTKPGIFQDLPRRSRVKHGNMLGVQLKGLWKLRARCNRSDSQMAMATPVLKNFAHLSDLVSSVLLALLGCWSVSNNVPHQSLGMVEKPNREARVLVPETWVSVNWSVSGHQCRYRVLSIHSESNINSLYRTSAQLIKAHVTHQQ